MKKGKHELEAMYFRSPLFRPAKGDSRRVAILEAAMECLAKDGILGLTIQAVAARLKMRRSHVVYYYSTAEEIVADLLGMILSIGQDITVAHLSSVKNPEKRLDAYVEATFLWFRMHPHHAGVLFLSCHFAALGTPHRKWLSVMKVCAEARICDILRSQPGTRRKSPAWIARRASDLRGLVMGNLLNHFTSGPSGSYNALEAQTIAAVRELSSGN